MLCAKEKFCGRSTSRVARREVVLVAPLAVAPPSSATLMLLPRETVLGADGRSGVTIVAEGDEISRVRGEIRRDGLSAAAASVLLVAVFLLLVLAILLMP